MAQQTAMIELDWREEQAIERSDNKRTKLFRQIEFKIYDWINKKIIIVNIKNILSILININFSFDI